MITLGDMLNVLLESDMLAIKDQNGTIYTGYKAMIHYEEENVQNVMDREVKKFRAVPEIRHKEYEKRKLMEPLHPEELPQYSFSDLRMTLYYTIII